MALKMNSMDKQGVVRERARTTVLKSGGTVCKGPMGLLFIDWCPSKGLMHLLGVETHSQGWLPRKELPEYFSIQLHWTARALRLLLRIAGIRQPLCQASSP